MINYRTSRSLIQKCLSLTIKKVSWKVWPDLAKFSHVDKLLNFLTNFFVSKGQILNKRSCHLVTLHEQKAVTRRALLWYFTFQWSTDCTLPTYDDDSVFVLVALANLGCGHFDNRYSSFCKYFVYPTATIQNGSAVLNHFICYLIIYPPFNWRFCVYEEGQFYLLLFKLTASFWSVQTQ